MFYQTKNGDLVCHIMSSQDIEVAALLLCVEEVLFEFFEIHPLQNMFYQVQNPRVAVFEPVKMQGHACLKFRLKHK